MPIWGANSVPNLQSQPTPLSPRRQTTRLKSEQCPWIRHLKVGMPDAPKILLHNVYGWFERVERGVYALTDEGRTALDKARGSHSKV